MDPHELGHQVFKRRKELGLSQEALAQQAEISRNYVSLIERGEALNVSMSIVGRLATVLGVIAAELTGEVEKPNVLIPSALRDFGVAEGLSLATVVQLLKIPRRGKEPQTAAEWRQLYTVVRKYLDDDVDKE